MSWESFPEGGYTWGQVRDRVERMLNALYNGTVNMLGPARFGDVAGGNYAEFEADGTLVFHGDARVTLDELAPLIGQRLESPSSRIVLDSAEGAVIFQNNAIYPTDFVYMNFQMNHDRDVDEPLRPHLHWWQVSANVPNWLMAYRWQVLGEAKATAWTEVIPVGQVFTYTSGTLNQICDFGDLATPANDYPSNILQVKLYRDTTNVSTLFAGADPETNHVSGLSFDIHKDVNKLGSRTSYAD